MNRILGLMDLRISACLVALLLVNIPRIHLDTNSYLELYLGVVQNVARVSLNGREIAILWKPPFCVDMTDATKPVKNKLVVEVANNWTNRLIGDAFLPPERQYCKTNLHSRLSRKERRLQPSGLLGPVKIHTATHFYGSWIKTSVKASDKTAAE